MEDEDLDIWDDLDDFEDVDLQMDYSGNGVQLITFTLGDEKYGFEMGKIRELIGYIEITRIPNMLDFIKGVINLRGNVIPVVDLRIKFEMPAGAYDKYTVIIIVEVGEKLIGVIVDTVADVVFLLRDHIRPSTEILSSINSEFIQGVGQLKNDMVLILDIDHMLSEEELGLLPDNP